MTATTLQHALRLHQAGQLAEAHDGYRRVLRRDPRQLDANYLLGVLLHQTGRHAEARAPLQRAIVGNASRAEFHNTLGDVHRVLGDLAVAEKCFRRAISLKPGYADAQVNLAQTLNADGRRDDAVALLFDAVAAQPRHLPLRQMLAALLDGAVLPLASATAGHALLTLCYDDEVSTQIITPAVLGLLQVTPEWHAVKDAVDRHLDPFEHAADAIATMMSNALLRGVLSRSVVCDVEVERVITAVRRHIARRAAKQGALVVPDATVPTALLCALAAQCFNVEYAFTVGDDEREVMDVQRDTLAAALAGSLPEVAGDIPSDTTAYTPAASLERALALAALYGPLHGIDGAARLLRVPASAWSEAFRALVLFQIADRQREHELAAQLPTMTAITAAVSQRVKSQYEANPYPRWMTLQRPRETTVQALLCALRPGITPLQRKPRVLVAGCGTGQQPIQTALSFPDADIEAFDLSTSSLAYAVRMAERYKVGNVRFSVGDILSLGEPDDAFDIVSCSGVLHHLANPMDGWQRLVAQLAPDGVMKIGLYSTSARPAVEAARSFARARGYPSDDDGIRACREGIVALPATHPARGVIAFVDFFSLSGCRDLVMHVQERTYTIPQIAECLSALNLRFLGFQLPQAVQARFAAAHPAEGASTDLAAWDVFETAHPDTFAAMYQFWCCRD